MTTASASPIPAHQPTIAELYTPKLVTILREGYGLKDRAPMRSPTVHYAETAAVALKHIKTSPTMAS